MVAGKFRQSLGPETSGETGLIYIQHITDLSSRPEAIDLSTVNRLIVDKKATIPFIVEGANLFLTQDAKVKLEKGLSVVFKDASVS